MTGTQACDTPAARPALALTALGVGSVVVGALMSPHVFNGLVALGRAYDSLAALREIELTRVTSRCVMLVALVGLWPTLKRCGLTTWRAVGLRPADGGARGVIRGWVLGVLSLLILFVTGWMLGAYHVGARSAVSAMKSVPLYLGVGLLVGCLEELLFRGVLYGALRRTLRGWSAAVVSSVIYSLVHFMRPVPPIEPVVAHWYSGLALSRHAFAMFAPAHAPLPLAITLFLAGLILCRLYERTHTLYLVIGLHAGWVWMIQVGADLFARDRGVWPWFFGDSTLIPKSLAALCIALVFVVFLLVAGGKPRGEAGAEDCVP